MKTELGWWECGNDQKPHGKKYIVTTDEHHGRVVMWLFPENLAHKEVAQRKTRGVIVSAGMILNVPGEGPVCYGESSTLDVKSRGEEDTILLRQLLARK